MKSFIAFLSVQLLVCISVMAQNQSKVINLGNQVNSEYNEINPVISPDGKTLYFSRVSHPQNSFGEGGSQDIWFSQQANGQWQPAQRMGYPLNISEYNCAYSITPDGNTLLIMGAYVRGQYETRGFSSSKRTANGWAAPEKINIPNLETMSKGEYMSGFLSNDGKTLLMSFSEKKRGIKDDLYVSFLQKNNTWTRPMNLGDDINTSEFTETAPFLASDATTLYFSSERTGGQGSNDVYYTKRLDKTWEKWSKPVNLGPMVNTDGYDAYYSVDAAGKYAYMISKKNSLGKGDVIRITLQEEGEGTPTDPIASNTNPAKVSIPVLSRPEPVVLITGKVIDTKTGKPIAAKITYEDLDGGQEIGTAETDPKTGVYKIVLPAGKKYGMRAVGKDFLAESKNIDLTQLKAYKEINDSDLKLTPIAEGIKVVLNNIFFDNNKFELRPESFPELDRMVLTMNENKTIVIEIGGHTDNIGQDAANLTLSQSRADAVREYLIGKSIEPDRVQSKGYGETQFRTTNDTEEGKQANRRVEFKILKK